MLPNDQRVEQFTAEIAEMKLPDTTSGRDRTYLLVGVGLMAVGIILAVAAYAISHSTTNPLQQRDAIVVALAGVCVAVIGTGIFVRYSIAQFMRFWLARLSWEQQTQTDQLVNAYRKEH